MKKWLSFLLLFLFISANCPRVFAENSTQTKDKLLSADAKADKLMSASQKNPKAQTLLEKEAAMADEDELSEKSLQDADEKETEDKNDRISRQITEDKLLGVTR